MTETVVAAAPTQYKRNALGHLVPVEQIAGLDLIRDELVDKIIKDARHLQAAMRDFKARTLDEMNAFVDLSANEYGTQIGGPKGNFTLSSFDGQYRVAFKKQDSLTFNERLMVAKALIDDLIHAWTQDSRSEIRTLIEHAFQTDKQGNINRGRVLGLLKLKIDDPQWRAAMEAIKDSIEVSQTKGYLMLYQRVGREGQYELISLDMATI